jgi:hypothetical protein
LLAAAKREVKTGDSEWTGPELNWRHTAFQAVALPTELPVQKFLNLANEVEPSEAKFMKFLGSAEAPPLGEGGAENKKPISHLSQLSE